MEVKDQKGGFLRRMLGVLAASLLVNMLAVKGVIRAVEIVIQGGEIKYF